MTLDPSSHISLCFTLKEALWLPSWGRMATEEDGLDETVYQSLCQLFTKMEDVREFFASPIRVHVAYRPLAYNAEVGGAPNSAHIYGQACDFDVIGMECDDVRSFILEAGQLDVWQMRMENRPGSNWVHLDTRQPLPGHPRFFLP